MSTSFPPPPQNRRDGKDFLQERLDGEQSGEQGYKDHANHGHTSAGHKLFHALAFRARVIIAVTFQQVDNSPDAEASAKSDNEGLKNGDCLLKKCHIIY